MKYHSYYMIIVSMGLCFIVAFLTILIHHKASIYFWDKLQSNPYLDPSILRKMRHDTLKQSLLMYGIYVSSVLCGLLFFLCHISNEFGEWFCKYGIAFCVIVYFSTKIFFYGYLLERAVLIQNDNHWIISPFIMKKAIPTYLFLYFVTHSITISLYFRGNLVDEQCKFETFLPPLFTISSFLDILHCIILTVLFLGPNCRDIYYGISDIFNSPQQIKTFIINTNIHLFCILLCIMSSMISNICFAQNTPECMWFIANINIMINCICSCFTLASNRNYVFPSHCKNKTILRYINRLFYCNYFLCLHYVNKQINKIKEMQIHNQQQNENENEKEKEKNDEDLDGDIDILNVPDMDNDQSIPMFSILNNSSLLTQAEIDDFDLPLMNPNDSRSSHLTHHCNCLTPQINNKSGMFNLI